MLEGRVIRPGLGLLAALFVALSPAIGAVNPVKDSEQVSGYLAKAKTQAIQLQKDAEEMNSFVWRSRSWQGDADKLNLIKGHVNQIGKLLTEMNDVRGTASPWQQDAMDRVTPMVRELAGNVEAQIKFLTKHEDRLLAPTYIDYAAANVDTSTEVATMLSDFVAYHEAKQKAEEIERDYELPIS